jgi:hypothetical protein
MVTVQETVVRQLEFLVVSATSTPVLGGQTPMPHSSAEAMPRINTLWEITIRITDFG